jgi:hypothetical protein
MYSCRISKKLEISLQILKKYSIIEFDGNLCIGSRVLPCGPTDSHDESNSRFSQFCERA